MDDIFLFVLGLFAIGAVVLVALIIAGKESVNVTFVCEQNKKLVELANTQSGHIEKCAGYPTRTFQRLSPSVVCPP